MIAPAFVAAGAGFLLSGVISHSLDQGKIEPGVPRFLSTLAAQPFKALVEAPFHEITGKLSTPLKPSGLPVAAADAAKIARDVIGNVLPSVTAMQKSIGPATEFSLFSEGNGLNETKEAIDHAKKTADDLVGFSSWAVKGIAKATGDKKTYETTHNVMKVVDRGFEIAQKTFMTLFNATIVRV
jgi:hypothetical protein